MLKLKELKLLSKKELEENINILEEENLLINQDIKSIYKRINNRIWILWLIPIVGWIIFSLIKHKRQENQLYKKPLIELKTVLLKNEIRIEQIKIFLQNK